MRSKLHYPIIEGDPNFKSHTVFRSVICDPSNHNYLDYDTQLKVPKNRRRGSLDDTPILGMNYRPDRQAYYVTDPKRVTCKRCKLIMYLKNKEEGQNDIERDNEREQNLSR